MFSIHGSSAKLCDGISRRELIRIGGLQMAGLSLPTLWQAQARAASSGSDAPTFGRAKNVIFLWLQGGPPQHETFDPKPDAPVEIRGSFRPISTNVPGIQFCELLPRTAAIADKLAVVRSLATDDNTHDTSAYWLLTGYPYGPGTARAIKPTDWPYFGSLVKMLKPSPVMPVFSSVWLPDLMRLNDNVQPAGQTAGFLGKQWEPERIVCDPSTPGFRIESFDLQTDVPALRLNRREQLLAQVERHFAGLERGGAIQNFDYLTQEALGLLSSGKARDAFALEQEPEKLRDRYGRSKWGQCVLLSRRLIEAGVRLVHVNWTREDGDTAIDNPMWDTHAQNEDRLKEVLCPQFDMGFTALLEDLEQRGLLSETLVVAIGEFGRTPKINSNGGRDHWGPVFSFALAGAGIAGGQVYGASDKQGAYPASGRVEPHDFVSTLFHLLGISSDTMFPDRLGRLLHVTKGEPLYKLLGLTPATRERTAPDVNLAALSPYDPNPTVNGGFETGAPLTPAGSLQSQRGWQGAPLWDAARGNEFGVRLVQEQASASHSGQFHVQIGHGLGGGMGQGKLAAGARVLLTQKVCSPRAGKYLLSAYVGSGGTDEQAFRELFKHLRCRLVLFGYQDLSKDPNKVREFASTTFVPDFVSAGVDGKPAYQRVDAVAVLRSQDGGAYETSRGVGVAIVVEKITPGDLDLTGLPAAFLRIDDVDLEFQARPRDENVKI